MYAAMMRSCNKSVLLLSSLERVEAFRALKLLVRALFLDVLNQLLFVEFLAAAPEWRPELITLGAFKVVHVLTFELQVVYIIIVGVLLGLITLLFAIEHILN